MSHGTHPLLENYFSKICWGGLENLDFMGGSIFPEGGQSILGENKKIMHNQSIKNICFKDVDMH